METKICFFPHCFSFSPLFAYFDGFQYIAGRATVVRRNCSLAFCDLQQMAQLAKYESFVMKWIPMADNKARLDTEKQRHMVIDKRNDAERGIPPVTKGLDAKEVASKMERWIRQRWRLEITEAFEWTVKLLPTTDTQPAPLEITRFGFERLLVRGKLLGMSKEFIDESFRTICVDGSGYVSFEDFWHWFEPQALKRHRRLLRQPALLSAAKGLSFSLADIYPPQTRAILTLMNRFKGVKTAKAFVLEGGDHDDPGGSRKRSGKSGKSKSFRGLPGSDEDEDEEEEGEYEE